MDRYTKGFVVASLFYFFLAGILGVWMGSGDSPAWANFTHIHFNLLGFMAMMIYGVGYFILPRFNGRPLHWPGWLAPHFYLANIALLGLCFSAAGRPSHSFTIFAILNVLAVLMFALNLGATVLIAPEEEIVAPPAATIEITPETRMSEIITNWPELVEILISNGFTPLADPDHLEKVKSLPVTLGMACERHGLDVELLCGLLTKGANSLEGERSAPAAGGVAPQPITSIAGTLKAGETINHTHIIGDILKIYPDTTKVFEKYYGSACFSCPGQETETIRQSAMIHNTDENLILADLNKVAQGR